MCVCVLVIFTLCFWEACGKEIIFSMLNLFYLASLVSCGMDMAGMVDFPVSLSPSSPGWSVTPQDVAVELGGYGTFRCHTLLRHTYIYWTRNGKTVVFAGTSKLLLSDSNRTLTYGPVETGDEATIGCVVDTPYGLLPSQVGKVSIKCKSF